MSAMLPILMAVLALGAGPAVPAAAAEPRTVTVAKGETLSSIAKRELGDPAAAPELAALNGLAPGAQPKKKTTLLLPGPERARAQSAIREAKAAGRDVSKAQEALRGARYTEAESLARAGGVVRFSVVVDPKRETRFLVKDGELAVTAAGKTATGARGQSVSSKGGAAPKITRAPEAPRLGEPRDGGLIADAGATLSWFTSKGARAYQIDVAKDVDFRERVASLPVSATALTLPPGLPKGVYYWRVSAIGAEGSESGFAGPRAFSITREPKGSSTAWDWGPVWDPWGEAVQQ